MKAPAWSYSSLTAFETCPKRYYHTKVLKDVADPPGEAAMWGSAVHKHLEDRVRDGTSLPVSISHYEGLVAPIIQKEGTKLIEQQFAITKGFQPTDWVAADTWCRGIVDVGVLSPSQDRAVLLDWKTGKRKTDNDQLMLFAGLAFAHYPNLRMVSTGFVWLKENKVDKQRFKREDTTGIWNYFAPRIVRFEAAYEKASFPPRPSGLCRKHCPLHKYQCEFSGRTHE